MKSKLIIIFILIMSILCFVACSDIYRSQENETDILIQTVYYNSDVEIKEEIEQNDQSSNIDNNSGAESQLAIEETEDKEESPLDDISFFINDVRNDVTGNWRVCAIAEEINMKDYAVDYYESYFENDDEIHGIINFNYNTTTKILVFGDLLNVTVYEYVDKEEHDAKIMFSGTLLAEYYINITDRAVEQIQ